MHFTKKYLVKAQTKRVAGKIWLFEMSLVVFELNKHNYLYMSGAHG